MQAPHFLETLEFGNNFSISQNRINIERGIGNEKGIFTYITEAEISL